MNRIKPILKTHFMPFPHESPRAETTEDGSELHKFRFAFPKGTLDLRMSGLELAAFVVKHIGAVLGMRLLDFTDYVCKNCERVSRMAPVAHVCPDCGHVVTTVNRTDVQTEFARIYTKFVLTPPQNLDELLPWVRVTKGTDDNDYIELNLHDRKPFADRKLVFDCGGGTP